MKHLISGKGLDYSRVKVALAAEAACEGVLKSIEQAGEKADEARWAARLGRRAPEGGKDVDIK